MNIIQASSILFNHFLKNDSVNNEQFSQLAGKKVSPTEAEAAFSYSLAEMENKGIVCKFIGTNSDNKAIFTWILKQPLNSIKQNIEIDGNTAEMISGVVNDFFKQYEMEDEFCNPLSIKENDIRILFEIIEILSQQNMDSQKDNTKEEKLND